MNKQLSLLFKGYKSKLVYLFSVIFLTTTLYFSSPNIPFLISFAFGIFFGLLPLIIYSLERKDTPLVFD